MTQPTPDADLARQAAQGDERAFAQLVRRHKAPLYRLLRRYTGNTDDAYEATQEAFVAAWSALSRYDPGRPFLAWLRTIAINKARDRGRRAAVRRLIFGERRTDADKAASAPDPSPAADDLLIGQERLDALDRAITRLPSNLKEALLLTALEGLSQIEAGQIVGVSPKTIETRAYRARKRLAQMLR